MFSTKTWLFQISSLSRLWAMILKRRMLSKIYSKMIIRNWKREISSKTTSKPIGKIINILFILKGSQKLSFQNWFQNSPTQYHLQIICLEWWLIKFYWKISNMSLMKKMITGFRIIRSLKIWILKMTIIRVKAPIMKIKQNKKIFSATTYQILKKIKFNIP